MIRAALLLAVGLVGTWPGFGLALQEPARPVSPASLSPDVVESRLRRVEDTNEERRDLLRQLFIEAGCSGPRLQETKAKHSRLPNVLCVLPGTSGQIIIVGAHYDFAGEGLGVVDNWSGASLLPSLYEALNTEPRQHTFYFIGFSDEEKGLFGSKSFAEGMDRTELGKTRAMVNLDSLGIASTKVWKSRSDPGLVELLQEVAGGMGLRIADSDVEDLGTSDSESFAKRHVPVVTLHSVTGENVGILHGSRDRLTAIDRQEYLESCRLTLAYLLRLDSLPPADPGSKVSGSRRKE